MAVEYQYGRHLFLSLGIPTTPPLSTVDFFRFNFLHDIESVLWMFMWFLFTTVPDGLDMAQTREVRRKIRAFAAKLFNGSLLPSRERAIFIEDLGTVDQEGFKAAFNVLDPLYGDNEFGTILYKGLCVPKPGRVLRHC